MPMTRVFTIQLEGEMGQPEIDRFRKLLDLVPAGRLTDHEDAEFGHRIVRPFEDGPMNLTLWRGPWRVILSYMGADPADGMAAELQGEVLAVAGALGLAVVKIEPQNPGAVADWAAESPQHRALTVRLATSLSIDERELVRRILHLHREGPSGIEQGWRYVRRGRTGKVLLQLLQWRPDTTELILLYDKEAPDDAIVKACLLQIGAAVAKAGLTITESDPLPVPGELEWERLSRPMRGAQDLDELWARLDTPAAAPHEARRGRLLAAIMSSAWRDVPDALRCQARDFLLGLPADRPTSLGLNDCWLL